MKTSNRQRIFKKKKCGPSKKILILTDFNMILNASDKTKKKYNYIL